LKAEQKVEGGVYRPWRTVVAGWLLVIAITPLSQFLTVMAVNASIETATPVGWALGLVVSMVLVGLVVRALARRRVFGQMNLALLYSMLALAVPLMNIGLIRQYFLASHAVLREYLYEGTSTYRTAYEALNDRWFPVVPTREGVAWNRAARTLRMLDDADARQRQIAARRAFAALEAATDPIDAQALRSLAVDLSLDDAAGVLARTSAERLQELGLLELLRGRVELLTERSRQAREALSSTLGASDEWPLSLLPTNRDQFGYSEQMRLAEQLERLDDAELEALQRRMDELSVQEDWLRAHVVSLGTSDRAQLLADLRTAESQRLAALDNATFARERNRLVYRLSRDERRAILRQDGIEGPNQNLMAFFLGLWETPQQRASMESMGAWERVRTIAQSIPWDVYRLPLLSWGALFGCIFLFLMCLAEWLRRKWVSRENLAFPLVEVVDYTIRHDCALETAGDLTAPRPRARLLQPLFVIGFSIGFLLLLLQGFHHYGMTGISGVLKFDFSANVFSTAGGSLKNIPTTVLVISPIVVGIVFLLSLEVGFSLWVSYVLYAVIVWAWRAAYPNIIDSNWTGFASGKIFPFPMEQMLGACMAYAVYHLWKARGAGQGGITDPGHAYVPPGLTRLGMIVLPPLILLLMWDAGLRNLPMILIFAGAILGITVAVARVRAETGLPGQHTVYEFTKLPIVLGMTGAMGAKTYAAFMNMVFLPTTLLFRTLPQQLENMELARRYRIPFRTIAASGVSTVFLTLIVGALSFLMLSFAMGGNFYGNTLLPPQGSGGETAVGIATYPLWVGHFLGEPGLDKFTTINPYRIGAILVGFGVVAVLLLLRHRFMRFPLHPIGYIVLLTSIFYSWADPYSRVPSERVFDSSVIWGSALVAWLIKRMIVKYGGMNVYKQAKPMFVGLIVGSVSAVFLWNMLDLSLSIYATGDVVPGDFIRRFIEYTPFTPAFY